MSHIQQFSGAILLSLISGCIGYYSRELGTYKEFIRSRLFDIVTELETLRDLSTKYWSRDVKTADRGPDDIAQEAEMVAKNHAINLALISLSANVDSRSYSELTDMASEIRRCSTGIPFEDVAADRLPDAHRIKEVHRRCFEMINKIRSCARSPCGLWKRR